MLFLKYGALLFAFSCLKTAKVIASEDALTKELESSPSGQVTDDEFVIKSWQKLRNELPVDLDSLSSGVSSNLESIVKSSNISSACARSLVLLFEDAKAKRTWAIRALTSWGRFPPSGLLSGTSTSFGAYDQCIETVNTKYCSVHFRPLLPKRPKYHKIIDKLTVFANKSLELENAIDFLYDKAHFYYYIPIRIGICIPQACSDEETSRMAVYVAKKMFLRGEVARCESKESINTGLNFQGQIALSILLMFLLAAITATTIDVYHRKEDKNHSQAKLMAFSLKRNLRLFYQAKPPKNEIRCLNGIRSLTMFWIIVGHSAVHINHQTFSNSYNVIDLITPFSAQAILNISYSVDTFFVISGLLTSYVTWKSYLTNKIKFDPIWFIFCRYVRLTPALLASICVMLLIPYLGSGPLWAEEMDLNVMPCQKYWWTSLLYIQSFVNPTELCSIPTWWLSSDMLFHIISIPIIILLFKSSCVGLILNFVVILAFSTANGIKRATSTDGLDPTIVPTAVQIDEYKVDHLFRYLFLPYLHGPPFFTGLFIGYILAKRTQVQLAQRTARIGWIISLVMIFFVLHISYPLTLGQDWPKLVGDLFSLTSRTIWGCCIAWIIFASHYGYGGWISTFLGHKFFTPIARISYCVYLTHMIFIYIFMGSRRELQHVSMYNCIYALIPHWFLAQVFGFVCHMLFELPFLNLIREITSSRSAIKLSDNQNIEVKSEDSNDCEQKIELL